jgi:hypothetical protein
MSDFDDTAFPSPRILRLPFVFVPDGAPTPLEWMAAHPGFVTVPARFLPRPQPAPASELATAPEPAPPEWLGDGGAPDG